MNNNIIPIHVGISLARKALAQSLSISLNELSAYNKQVINHDKNEDCLESKLLKLINIINLRNYNTTRGRADA